MPRARTAVHPPEGGKVLTKQSDAAATDVNQIMERFITHPPQVGVTPKYGDFSNSGDYHTALNLINQAQREFANVPASVRAHVDNDPGQFLDLVYDPDRIQELRDLGLVEALEPEAAPEPAPIPVPIEPDP